jgi:hypothetical protein
LRVALSVKRTDGEGWIVDLQWEASDGRRTARREPRRTDAHPHVAPQRSAGGGANASVEELEDVARAIAADQPLERAPLERYGHHLFQALLGTDLWNRLSGDAGGDLVELALMCGPGAEELHGVTWELLHDGKAFLAIEHNVVVTRVVPVADAEEPRTIHSPARVLFAIGADLTDPDIRPGAEFLGLLRRIEDTGGSIQPYILERAGPERLARAVRDFHPDVVHVIAHGRVTSAGDGVIMMRHDDPADQGSQPVNGATLAHALHGGVARGPIPLVVLSACHGATAGGPHSAPLARCLVENGAASVVIAMAGRVADLACRLFTRRFGHVLVDGSRLIEGMADARRAAYCSPRVVPDESIDWALPSVFLADSVPTNYAPVTLVDRWRPRDQIREFAFTGEPVFCGRRRFFDAYEELIDPRRDLSVLVVYTEGRRPGMGENRLLKELAATALRQGHIPLRIMPTGANDNGNAPKTMWDLATRLVDALIETRSIMRLEPPRDAAVINELCRAVGGMDDPLESDLDLRRALMSLRARPARFAAEVLRDAFAIDVATLVKDAGAAGIGPVVGEPRPLLLLGGVERWDEARDVLFDRLLGSMGLGAPGIDVPVIVSCALGDLAAEGLLQQKERAAGESWLRFMEVTPFEDTEELLAFEWVLLNPRKDVMPGVSGDVFAARTAPERWSDYLRASLEGVPGNLNGRWAYVTALGLVKAGDFVRADDEQAFAAMLRRQGETP